MKVEKEKIELGPINIDQIRLQGFISGTKRKANFKINPMMMEYLELMKDEFSIYEISKYFLDRGQLISYSDLKTLVAFLISEDFIKSPLLVAYFKSEAPKEMAEKGLLDKIFGKKEEEASAVEKIRHLPFFRSLPKEVVDLFTDNMKVIEAPANIRVCEAGQLQRNLFGVLEGSVSVYKNGSSGTPKKVASLEKGSVFGEVGFFLGKGRTADVITDSDCSIAKFKYIPEVYESLIHKDKAQQLQKRFWLVHALLSSPFFNSMPDDCFDALIFAGDLRSFHAGEALVTEGSMGISLYIVIQGSVEVSQKGKPLKSLQQGDCFGEMALLLNQGIRTATVRAKEGGLVLEITAPNFYQLLGENLFLACEFEALSLRRVNEDQSRVPS